MPKKKPATKKKAATKKRAASSSGLEFNHAMIYVTELARSLAFYRDALGFELIETYPGAYARLRSPGGTSTIALHALEPGRKMNAGLGGLRLYFEVEALDAFCAGLEAKGVVLDDPPTDMPWGWRHAYVRDPDGHELSLYRAGEKRLQPTR
jgi:catechol 2,3-dioxygenase-like lactoylglutathione lyase family enzyme